jgi:hypothetical protein
MSNKNLRFSSLSSLGFQVNIVISDKQEDTVSFNEIYDNIENGTLLKFLEQRFPDDFDFSLFRPDDGQVIGLNNIFNGIAGGCRGSEYKKFGIESSGLHLLMAFILEAMQRQVC